MLRGKHWVGLFGGTVVVLMLTACATPAPVRSSAPPVTAVATPSPAFTSDADAEAAAVAFYNHYLDVSNSIGESATAGPQTLKPLLGPEEYRSEESELASLRSAGVHVSGPTKLRTFKPQSISLDSGKVVLYVCLDTRQARLINTQGRDVTPSSRAEGVTLVVKLSGLPSHPLIQSSDQWSGRSVC